MCLDATKRSTNGLLATMKRNGGKMTFYKMVKVYHGPIGFHTSSPYHQWIWHTGWNRSSTNEGLCKFDDHWLDLDYMIEEGFHVFMHKTSVEKAIKDFPKHEIAAGQTITFIKVVGYKKHLIASGTFSYGKVENERSAAFSKLFVPKSEINRVRGW